MLSHFSKAFRGVLFALLLAAIPLVTVFALTNLVSSDPVDGAALVGPQYGHYPG